MTIPGALHHPKFPDYVAVNPKSIPTEYRPPSGTPCFDCPGRECNGTGARGCPIEGVWVSTTNVVAMRLAGVDVCLSDVDRKLNLEKFK